MRHSLIYRAVDIDPIYDDTEQPRKWLFNRKALHCFTSRAARDAWVKEEPYSYEMKGRKPISALEAAEILTFSTDDVIWHKGE